MNRWLGWFTLDQKSLQPAMRLLEQLQSVSPWLILAALAVVPGIFEEWFFRGFLFGAVRERVSPAKAILGTALLFGAFHVLSAVLAVERFLPSTCLGLVLGWVRWRTASVLPGMALHATHNGLLLMMARYRTELAAWGWGIQEQAHLPPAWLAAGGVVAVLGAGLVWWSGRPKEK